ncbi:MAG: hypothetical protein M1549_01465 [Candidatus Dependentiae bacterium]|nr:hypothetical protein [Candidatus Dependentiae bacterium]
MRKIISTKYTRLVLLGVCALAFAPVPASAGNENPGLGDENPSLGNENSGFGQENKTREFYNAIINAKFGEIKNLLDSGFDPNTPILPGVSPVHLLLGGSPKRFKILKLLAKETDIDLGAKDQDNCVPLHEAVFTNPTLFSAAVKTAKFLAGNGGGVNTQNKNLRTSMHNAVVANSLGMTKLILEAGGDITIKIYLVKTPLETAFNSEIKAYLTLGQDLLEGMKKPEKLEEFIKKYLELDNPKKVAQNLTDIMGILAVRLDEVDAASLKSFYSWTKKHATFSLKTEQDSEEKASGKFNIREVCLDYAEKYAKSPHILLGVVRMGLEFVEMSGEGTFNYSLHNLIKKGCKKNTPKTGDTKKRKEKKELLHKQWEELSKQIEPLLKQNNSF